MEKNEFMTLFFKPLKGADKSVNSKPENFRRQGGRGAKQLLDRRHKCNQKRLTKPESGAGQ